MRVARVLFAAAGLAAALALWALFTGGFRVHLFGIPISARGAHRAGVLALLLAGAGLALHRPLQHRLLRVSRTVTFRPLLPIGVAIVAAAVLWTALSVGTRTAAGSDIYGYVSQAALWTQGIPRIHQPIAGTVPWPDADWTFSPLGYKPAPGHTIVPTYAPGLPLLMALFMAIFGAGAEYWVVPLCGAALVWATYALGARISDSTIGAIAAVSVATSPVILFMTLWSMSDVPVALFWLTSLLLATRWSTAGSLAAGAAAGVAVLIRPNLVPLALVPLVITVFGGDRRGRLARTVAYGVACAPFALFIAWMFNMWYGSPLRSGYGEASDIYEASNAGPNLAKYTRWLWESQGPMPFLFPAALLFVRAGERRVVRLALAAFVALVFACYLPYIQFDAWWYLRFVIPALPVMFLLALEGIARGTERLGAAVRGVTLVLVAVASTSFTLNESFRRDVFSIGRGEQKYEHVGRHVAAALPANAAIYAMQHTGSIRHYAGRVTLRLDYMDPSWLDRSIAHMRTAGYEPYFVLDDWEVPLFIERFRTQETAALLALEPATPRCTHRTFVYEVRGRRVWRVPTIGCQ